MTATAYIQSLEKRLGEFEATLSGREGRLNGEPGSDGDAFAGSTPAAVVTPSVPAVPTASSDARRTDIVPSPAKHADEDIIETMVDANDGGRTGQTPGGFNGSNVWDSHRGSFAGLSILRRVHDLCRSVSGLQQDKAADQLEDDLTHAFDIAPPDADSTISWEAFVLLPPRDKLDHAVEVVVDQACCNMQFLDREQLHRVVEDVYEETDSETTSHARKPLALIYAVLALSRRYDSTIPPAPGTKGERTINGWVQPMYCGQDGHKANLRQVFAISVRAELC